MSAGITIEFHSGVVRFDASGHLFVHLTHSRDDAHPLVIGDGTEVKAPAKDRRARVLGSGGAGKVAGKWPSVTDLPRGLVVEIREYDSVTLRDDGAMDVVMSDFSEIPDWFQGGEHHLFRRDNELIRMWAKSSLPEGAEISDKAVPNRPTKGRVSGARATISYADKEKPAPEAAPTKKATSKKATAKKAPAKKATTKKATTKKATTKKTPAKKAPAKKATAGKKSSKAETSPKKAAAKKKTGGKKSTKKKEAAAPEATAEAPPVEAPAPEPKPEPQAEPYRPERMPAGSYTAGRNEKEGKRGLPGCGATLVLLAIGVLGVIAALL